MENLKTEHTDTKMEIPKGSKRKQPSLKDILVYVLEHLEEAASAVTLRDYIVKRGLRNRTTTLSYGVVRETLRNHCDNLGNGERLFLRSENGWYFWTLNPNPPRKPPSKSKDRHHTCGSKGQAHTWKKSIYLSLQHLKQGTIREILDYSLEQGHRTANKSQKQLLRTIASTINLHNKDKGKGSMLFASSGLKKGNCTLWRLSDTASM